MSCLSNFPLAINAPNFLVHRLDLPQYLALLILYHFAGAGKVIPVLTT